MYKGLYRILVILGGCIVSLLHISICMGMYGINSKGLPLGPSKSRAIPPILDCSQAIKHWSRKQPQDVQEQRVQRVAKSVCRAQQVSFVAAGSLIPGSWSAKADARMLLVQYLR